MAREAPRWNAEPPFPLGQFVWDSFSQQMSTASRNPAQVRLPLSAQLQPASLPCLSAPCQASDGLSYPIDFPPSLALQKPMHVFQTVCLE